MLAGPTASTADEDSTMSMSHSARHSSRGSALVAGTSDELTLASLLACFAALIGINARDADQVCARAALTKNIIIV